MKNLLIILIVVLFTSNSFATETQIDNQPISRLVETIISAKPTKRVHPKYPVSAARNGQEGWVQMSYVISETGKVQDVVVLDHGGSKKFIREATKAIKKWNYTPAYNQQGEAIESCQNSVQLDFKMAEGGNVSNKFYRLYKAANTALTENKVADLALVIDKIDAYENKNTTDLAWSHYLKFRYFQLINDQDRQYQELHNASRYSNKTPKHISRTLPEDISVDVLQRLFILQIEKNLFAKAKTTFKRISHFKTDMALQFVTKNSDILAKIDNLILSDKPIIVDAEINKFRWMHKLIRNSFAIADIEGALSKLEVRCQGKRHVFTIQADNQWSIPESWGQCNILVEGDEKTRFNVIELNQSI